MKGASLLAQLCYKGRVGLRGLLMGQQGLSGGQVKKEKILTLIRLSLSY